MNVTPRGGAPTVTDTLSLELRDDGIMHVISRPGPPQTSDDARVNLEIARKVSDGMRVPVLLDVRNTGPLSREAREVYAGPDGTETVSALAIVADTAFSRVVGNIFIRLARTRYPVKLFSGDEPAIKWLGENG